MSWQSVAIPFIQSFEGCKLTPYRDIVGVLTCGWGCTGPDVVEGTPWTQEQADTRLAADVEELGAKVDALVKVALNANQKAALVSFVYNLGATALRNSTLLRILNTGDYDGAMLQFLRWDHAGNDRVPGLTRRRNAEANLFQELA